MNCRAALSSSRNSLYFGLTFILGINIAELALPAGGGAFFLPFLGQTADKRAFEVTVFN
jgi:hypothetical protein